MANEFIARKGLIVLANGATVTGSLNVSGSVNAVGFNVSASAMSASVYYGDGSQLTGVTATGLDIDNFGSDLTGITIVGTDKIIISDNGTEGRVNVSQLSTPLAGTGLEADSGTIRIATSAAGTGLSGGGGVALSLNTSSLHFVSGAIAALPAGTISSSAQFNSLSAPFTGSFTGSFTGDGSQLTGIATTLSIAGATSGTDSLNLKTETLAFSGSNGITATVTDNTVTFAAPLNTVTGSAQIDHNLTANFVANEHIDHTTVSISAGSGLSGGGDITSTRTLSLDTGSSHFITGSTQAMDLRGVYSSSTQIAAIGFATTASNTFTGIQNIDNTTQSTNWTDGALVVDGGVGIAKNLNVSGSVTIEGLLTVVSMSTQYVTSSQYVVGDNRIILNSDDYARFSGMSIFDSGSSSPTTASIFWDSLNHKFIYENLSGSSYNSAMFIAGPRNYDALGNETGLTDHRVPVAHGNDHIDSRPESSSIRVDFPTRLTHIEAGLQVTGSISSSVGFSGDGSNLTGIVTNLNITGSEGGTGTVSLKTQGLTIDGENGISATVSGQTITISGSNATTTNRGVASYTGSQFTVTNGEVTAQPISFNGTNILLGGTYAFGLQNITPSGATTTDRLTLSGGAIIGGSLISGSSNTSAAGTSVVVTQFPTASYDAAHFDYVLKDGTNLRTGTVMVVWKAGTSTVEYTDTSTNDIGDTLQATFDADTSLGNVRLKLTANSGTWTVKTSVRTF